MNLVFNVFYSKEAQRQLKKMDKQSMRRIVDWVECRLVNCHNPRLWGEALVGEFSGFWKYRIGDFRLICEIKDCQLVIQVVMIGDRKEVYR